MERPIDMTEDELLGALRQVLHIEAGPPQGVRYWTANELAELLGLGHQTAVRKANEAVAQGEMGKCMSGRGYVYWFTTQEGK